MTETIRPKMTENTETVEKQGSIAHRLYTGKMSYDFMGNRKKWFIITGAAMLIALLILVFKQLSLGIEFRGGTDFQVPVTVQANTVEELRTKAETSFEVKELDAQVFSLGSAAVRVQTRSLTSAEVAQTRIDITKAVGANPDDVTYNTIGGSWGDKISRDAGVAVAVFLVLVMALISFYFMDWRMAVAAIIALAHDMVLTLGVYALVGFTVTPSTVIGMLTILAYSLYDTVVVFDKTKENTKDLEESTKTYSQLANLAINQVLVRSINTTVIGVLPVLAMFLAGVVGQSNPLKDLGLALLVGMIAGAFSSIFIATPLLAWLKERTAAMKAHREKLAKREERVARRQALSKDKERSSQQPKLAGVAVERKQRRTHLSRAERKGKK